MVRKIPRGRNENEFNPANLFTSANDVASALQRSVCVCVHARAALVGVAMPPSTPSYTLVLDCEDRCEIYSAAGQVSKEERQDFLMPGSH